MDFFIDLIGEIIFEGLFELATNKKISKWIRYPLLGLFIIIYGLIIGLLIVLGIELFNKNRIISYVLWGLGLIVIIITILSLKKKMQE